MGVEACIAICVGAVSISVPLTAKFVHHIVQSMQAIKVEFFRKELDAEIRAFNVKIEHVEQLGGELRAELKEMKVGQDQLREAVMTWMRTATAPHVFPPVQGQ